MERIYLERFISRINEPVNFIQVIYGPRQVGKTTLVLQLLEKIKPKNFYFSADVDSNTNNTWIQQCWETARLSMKVSEEKEVILVLDEVQKINNWSEIVKSEWDRDRREKVNIKVILLGSSRLLIQKGLTESLAGRFETFYLSHWSYSEMKEAFGLSLEEYIYFGGYPGSASLIHDEKRWKNYINDSLIETSISKDILMLTRVDKPAILRKLFELGCLYSSRLLSFTKILGQLQDAGNTTTLSHYLQLLSDAGLLAGIEKFSGEIVRKRASVPKFQVFNNALLSAQDVMTFKEIRLQPKEWGRYVESAVGSHLINNAATENFKLYYWRENNQEVDYILEKGAKRIAIEVKSGVRYVNSGMSVFVDKYKPQKMLLVGTGGIDLETFFTINPVDLF